MFEELVNGQQQQAPQQMEGVGPPKDQAEFQNRVSAWQQFQDRVKNDPSFRFGLMQAATHLMQPINPGQTTLGHIGQALSTGTQSYALANQAMSREQATQRELTMKEAESGAKVEQSKASTKLTNEQAATEPTRRAQLDAQRRNAESEISVRAQELPVKLDKYKAEGNYYGALAEFNKNKADIEKKYGVREAEAKIKREEAAAAASWASAQHAQALAKKVGEDMQREKGWTASAPKVDDSGVATIVSTNRSTGETRIIRSIPPITHADAVARAKVEIRAVEDATPGQLFGTSEDRIKALERLVGEPVKSTSEAVAKLAERYKTGGTYVTSTDAKGNTRTFRDPNGLDKPQQPEQPSPQSAPSAATPVQLPPDVQQSLRDNRGQAGNYVGLDGRTWRFDGRGGAALVQQPPQSQPQQPAQQPGQQPAQNPGYIPGVSEKQNVAADPVVVQLQNDMRAMAQAGDAAKVQELRLALETYIRNKYGR